MLGAVSFSRSCFASSRRVISLVSSMSLLESCSLAACSQSSFQRSWSFITSLCQTWSHLPIMAPSLYPASPHGRRARLSYLEGVSQRRHCAPFVRRHGAVAYTAATRKEPSGCLPDVTVEIL